MLRNAARLAAIVTACTVFGCCGPSTGQKSALTGIAGPCAGQVMEPPPGLVEVDNRALLDRAVLGPGNGGLCTGKVFRVTRSLTLYRVWDGSRSATEPGKWWSFSPPQGPRPSYREEKEICPSWSALDRVSACSVKEGALVVIGPGQSAKCAKDGVDYGTSPVNQIFVPNDATPEGYVGDCISEDWPRSAE